MRAMKSASTAALVGIWTILLTAFVVTILYVGRQLLIPLAAMLTFLLAPLVGYIERWIGRIAAVLIVVKVVNFLQTTSLIAQTTLRSVLGQAPLDDLLSQRESINLKLQEIIDRQTEPWGVKVTAVEV
jgi:Ca2+/Na+ antiporter